VKHFSKLETGATPVLRVKTHGNYSLSTAWFRLKGCYRAMYPKMSQITLKKCVQLTSENKFAKQKNHPIHHRVAL
jgi:hypothetical protein